MTRPEASVTSARDAFRAVPAWRGRDRLAQRVYRFRVLGLGLAALPIGVGFWEQRASWPLWLAMLFSNIAWPHLAYWRARRSRDPYRAEVGNLLFDSAQAGFYAGALHFNPLATALLITIAIVDKINSGVRGLWLRSLPGMLAGMLVGGLISGFSVNLQTSLPLVLACLPMLIIHTSAVSLNGALLMRRVHQQNRRLDEIGRIDSLTGVSRRGHWEVLAEEVLRRARADGSPASLVLLDLNRFKEVNDTYGHAVGDELLRAVAQVEGVYAGHGHCGRIGGDEFVVACWVDAVRAAQLADEVQARLGEIRLQQAPQVRASTSCGVAELTPGVSDVQAWMVAADAAMYRHKRERR